MKGGAKLLEVKERKKDECRKVTMKANLFLSLRITSILITTAYKNNTKIKIILKNSRERVIDTLTSI